MSSGPFGQQAITVQESQLGGLRFAGTFMAGMCFEYLILAPFLIMASSFLLIGSQRIMSTSVVSQKQFA
jgi:hypothetical protein